MQDLVEALISFRDQHRNTLTRGEMDLIADAANEITRTRKQVAPTTSNYIPRRPDGRVDIAAMNAANCPDVDHGGREEDCQDNDEGA